VHDEIIENATKNKLIQKNFIVGKQDFNLVVVLVLNLGM